ncbi:uncharacterized protein LOC125235643 [Leguminivora glycinivorella]|uniref:uncharacterized protein LOC125235643 n=1 Tax=Leguminivora glycinivorella TaxID=1035111 RepID=UPI00200E3B8C|nr:uncharacterized protein LOC125235643 [Leguminivora glycinivorella]
MGAVSYKNEIKNLFLIVNSYLAMSLGLFPVSLGTALVVTKEWDMEIIVASLVMGTFILGLTALGHFGAILDRKTMLVIYAVAVGLVLFMGLVVLGKLPRTGDILAFGIFHIIVTLTALLLSVALKRSHNQLYPVTSVNAGTPSAPTLPTAL